MGIGREEKSVDKCPNCGAEIRSTSRFCTSCGFRIPERPTADSSADAVPSYASTWQPQPTRQDASLSKSIENREASESRETAEKAEASAPAHDWSAPLVAPSPIVREESAGFREVEETIADISENKINIALYHIDRIREMLPDLSQWTQDRANAVNDAIAHMEEAIKGRESDDEPYHGLRETVAAARRRPRDIDVMVALTDRATDIADLLAAHDSYSIGIRKSLIALKPLAVEYVRVSKRRPRVRRPSSSASPSQMPAETSPPGMATIPEPSAPVAESV
jgi:hypothetical protein